MKCNSDKDQKTCSKGTVRLNPEVPVISSQRTRILDLEQISKDEEDHWAAEHLRLPTVPADLQSGRLHEEHLLDP